jgi:hypothetical protein
MLKYLRMEASLGYMERPCLMKKGGGGGGRGEKRRRTGNGSACLWSWLLWRLRQEAHYWRTAQSYLEKKANDWEA